MKSLTLVAMLAGALLSAQLGQAAPLPGESKYDCVYRHVVAQPAAQRGAFAACGCSGFEDMSKICRPAENAARTNAAAKGNAAGAKPPAQAAIRPSTAATYECSVSTTDGGMPKVQVQANSDETAKAAAERQIGKRAYRDTASCRRISGGGQQVVQQQPQPQSPVAERRAPQRQDPVDAVKNAIGDVLKRK